METVVEKHIDRVDQLFRRACFILQITDIRWKPMSKRTAPVNTAKDYSLGYADIKKREVTIDILTPRKRKPKSENGILRLFAHEIAHIQKPPYKERFRGRWITRMHYPEFYDQVNKNVELFKKDSELSRYFRNI